MAIKIIKLSKSFSEPEFAGPKCQVRDMIDSATEFFDCCRGIRANRIGVLNVYFPLTLQCIELYAKALAIDVDSALIVKKYSHHVVRIMESYRSKVAVFDFILSDPKKEHVLAELEFAYFNVKYGDTGIFCDKEDFDLIDEIIRLLQTEAAVIRKK